MLELDCTVQRAVISPLASTASVCSLKLSANDGSACNPKHHPIRDEINDARSFEPFTVQSDTMETLSCRLQGTRVRRDEGGAQGAHHKSGKAQVLDVCTWSHL